VLFGLKAIPAAGECRLEFHLMDTHRTSPPTVRVEVNGKAFDRSLPGGAGDASVNGQPAKGREHKFTVAFPSSLLKVGDNEVRITTLKGSWLLYDGIGLETPAGAELGQVQSRTLLDDVKPVRAVQERDGKAVQPILVTLRHFGEEADAVVRVEGVPPSNRGQDARDTSATRLSLKSGMQETELMVGAVETETKRQISVEVSGKTVASREVTLKPVKKLTVYITPHSHTDIGYTEIQTAIETKQVQNLVDGMAAAKRTADYPPGARFVWNVEVLWAADLYLHG
jgi:hypothetical protein